MNDSHKKIVSIIPISPKEPLGVIKYSVKCMKELEEPEGYKTSFYFVIDTEDSRKDERVEFLRKNKDSFFNLKVREPGSGKRAGAINSVLEEIDDPDFVGLFDVDSRPEKDFLKNAVDEFDDGKVFMVTAERKILNKDQNFITQIVDVEFRLLTDIQKILDSSSGFNHFNGLIGLLDGKYLKEKMLNSKRLCEDTDFSERAYLDGKSAKIVSNSSIGEQAVTNFYDLYYQKIRWMNGAIEGITNYLYDFLSGGISRKIKITWFFSMILPFFSFLFSPLSLFYGIRLANTHNRPKNIIKRTIGLFFLSWLVSYCGLVALLRNASGMGVKWRPSQREDL